MWNVGRFTTLSIVNPACPLFFPVNDSESVGKIGRESPTGRPKTKIKNT